MSEILFEYHKVNPTTWVYLSSLLTIGLYFKFSRVLSVRNLDLLGLIMLAPGLLVVELDCRKRIRPSSKWATSGCSSGADCS
jgi:hypothetical protein